MKDSDDVRHRVLMILEDTWLSPGARVLGAWLAVSGQPLEGGSADLVAQQLGCSEEDLWRAMGHLIGQGHLEVGPGRKARPRLHTVPGDPRPEVTA